MIAPVQIALSGLNAARNRLETAASNIVNAQNTSRPKFSNDLPPEPSVALSANLAYAPQRAVDRPNRFGGVLSDREPINPASVTVYSPGSPNADSNGMVDMPNVSLPEEIVQMRIAANAYKANARVMRTADEMEGALLDTLG